MGNMEQQFYAKGGAGSNVVGFFSLSSMYRACGSPPGKDPSTWGELASPLLWGVAQYLEALQEWKGVPKEKRSDGWPENVFFTLENPAYEDSFWRVGDGMGTYFVAMAYARFLDNDFQQEFMPT
jgi:hypothetical protein